MNEDGAPIRPLEHSSDVTLLLRYAAMGLMVVGGLEWLLGRTVSRMAAAPTLEGTPRQIIETLGRLGQFLVSPAFLLALLLFIGSMTVAGSRFIRANVRGNLPLAVYLSVFGLVSAAHTFFPTLGWLNIAFNVLALVGAWWVALYSFLRRERSLSIRVGVLLVALGYSGWFYFVLQEALAGMGVPLLGAPVLFLNLGEIAAVAAPFAFFAAIAVPHGQWRHAARWILPVIVAALFSAGNIADAVLNQGFSGVFAIWSLGFNLFLPWPVYTLALLAFLYSVLTCFSRGLRAAWANPNVGFGLLLLLYAGYTLQVPYQFVLALLSLSLLAELATPFSTTDPHDEAATLEVPDALLPRARSEATYKPS